MIALLKCLLVTLTSLGIGYPCLRSLSTTPVNYKKFSGNWMKKVRKETILLVEKPEVESMGLEQRLLALHQASQIALLQDSHEIIFVKLRERKCAH